jgi:hypothetical protein
MLANNCECKETTPTIGVGMNVGHFSLIVATNSYVNLEWGHWVRLWDKCYCLLLKVVPIAVSSTGTKGSVGEIILLFADIKYSRMGVTRAYM